MVVWRGRGIFALSLAVSIGMLGLYRFQRARADGIPQTTPLFYGGYVEEDGVGVSGSRDLTVRLYDQPGTLQCQSVHPRTTFDRGHFRVALTSESRCLEAVRAQPDLWGELAIGATTLGGRVKLGAVPYAVEAHRASGLTAEATTRLVGSIVRAEQSVTARSTGTWVDVPGTNATIMVLAGQSVNAMVSGVMRVPASTGTGCAVRIVLDNVALGDRQGNLRVDVAQNNDSTPFAFTWWPADALAPGAHQLSLQILKLSPGATECSVDASISERVRMLISSR